MSAVSPARRVAFSILRSVESGKGHSDDLLRGRQVAALSDADRKLATALVLGTLRWQIELDRHILPLLKHPNAKLDPEALIGLRMGAFQLLHMDRIPARAAIDESVELTKQAGHRFASGMVNAVLRKLSGSQHEQSARLPNEKRPQGHPAWLVERWREFYGDDVACAICARGQAQPTLAIRLTESEVERELASEGISLAPGEFLTAARRVLTGDVTQAKALREGRIRIQDEGSQLIAELAPRGNAILDCCAAPGGKTLILAERNPTAHITACEASPVRRAHLRERLAPLGDRVECRLADAAASSEHAIYDVAVADVPCSGTGTLARNPEIRHRLRPEDLARQSARQQAILRAALQTVHPNGYVLYSTCSLEPEENEQVIAAVLRDEPNAAVVPLRARVEQLVAEGILIAEGARKLVEFQTHDGCLRLLPGASDTDGFFAALLQRTA